MWDGERAQSTQIGFILLFAAIIIFFSTYQAVVVPSQNQAVEVSQNIEAQGQFEALRNVIVGAPGQSNSRRVTIPLGTDYPSRVVAMNPGPATGRFRTANTTDERVAYRLRNVQTTGEVGDFWNGTDREYNTGQLRYEPNYNEYQQPPATVYESTVVYNQFSDRAQPVTGQTLVQGRTINLIALNGSVSTTRAGPVTVDPRYVSASDNSVLVSGEGSGIAYEYYEADYGSESVMPDFDESNLVRTGGTTNFDINESSAKDSFAYRFEGDLSVDTAGDYTFYTNSDDGSRLYIDGTLVVNNEGQHGATEESGTVSDLGAGEHNITVTFFEDDGQNVLDVSWQGPDTGGNQRPIPDAKLSNDEGVSGQPIAFEVPTRLSADRWRELLADQLVENGGYVDSVEVSPSVPYEYYEADYSGVSMPAFDPSNLVRTGQTDEFDITDIPHRADDFAFRFNKRISVPTTGQYTFRTTSDDGSRLYIDGQLVVDNPGEHPPESQTGTIDLDAGTHDITVTYFERGGGTELTTDWDVPGDGSGFVPLDASALSDRNGRTVDLTLRRDATYRLRMARVGVGTNVAPKDPAYVTTVAGNGTTVAENETRRVVFEVRDRYNNPVPNVLLNVSSARTDSSVSPRLSATDQNGQVRVSYEAPEDIDGRPVVDRLHASLDVDPAPVADFDTATARNATATVRVRNADGSGFSGPTSSTAPYEVRWQEPTGAAASSSDCDAEQCAIDASTSVTTPIGVTTVDTAIGVGVDYSVNASSVGRVDASGETDTNGESDTTFEAEGTGSVGVYAVSGGSVDIIELLVSGIVNRTVDDFETGQTLAANVNWTNGSTDPTFVRENGGTRAGEAIGTIANSGSRAVVIENTTASNGNVLVSEQVSAADQSQVYVEYAIKAGDDQSAPSRGNEDLLVEYREEVGGSVQWRTIETVDAGGQTGYVTNSTTLSTGVAYDGFRLRFRQPNSNPNSAAPWYVDDVCIAETASQCP